MQNRIAFPDKVVPRLQPVVAPGHGNTPWSDGNGGLEVGYLLSLTRKRTWGRNLHLDVCHGRGLCLGSVVVELNRRQTSSDGDGGIAFGFDVQSHWGYADFVAAFTTDT